MRKYKACVKNKETGKREIIEMEYDTKAHFIRDIRFNGYAVSDYKVYESQKFNAVVDSLSIDGSRWEWEYRSKEYDQAKKEERS